MNWCCSTHSSLSDTTVPRNLPSAQHKDFYSRRVEWMRKIWLSYHEVGIKLYTCRCPASQSTRRHRISLTDKLQNSKSLTCKDQNALCIYRLICWHRWSLPFEEKAACQVHFQPKAKPGALEQLFLLYSFRSLILRISKLAFLC